MLVGTTKGVVAIERGGPEGERSESTSEPAGSVWRVARRSLADQHIHAILIEPASGMVFAGTNGDGIFASKDGGKNWERRDTGLTEKKVYSINTSTVAGKTRLFAGTEPARLFYSDDLGAHWQESPSLRTVPSVSTWTFPAPPHAGHLKNIAFDPKDPRVMYAGVEQGGLLKSTDAGITWSELFLFVEAAGDVHRVQIDPTNPKHMWVPTGSGLYMSNDTGASWQRLTNRESEVGGYPDGLVFNPRQPSVMFLSASEKGPGSWRTSHFAGSRISRSKDGGLTWQQAKSGLPDRLQPAIEAMCLEDSGKSFTVFAGTTAGEVWCSEDSGDSWSRIVDGIGPVSKGGHYANLAVPAGV